MKPNFAKIAVRLPLTITALVILSAGIITWMGYSAAYSALLKESSHRLRTTADARAHEVSSWLGDLGENMDSLRDNPSVALALQGFQIGWSTLPGDKTAYLKSHYIDRNPNPIGRKAQLDTADDGTPWSQAHARFHQFFRDMKTRYGFYDMFLLDPAGNVIYTVEKEQDFATNIMNGPWAASGLGDVFRAALKAEGKNQLSDFASYAPSNGDPAAFLAARVDKRDGTPLGVVAVQVPTGALSNLVNNRTGLGRTDQILLIGADGLRRAESPDGAAKVLDPVRDGPQIRAAMAGEATQFQDVTGSDGHPAAAAVTPIKSGAFDWALVVEEDRDELLSGLIAYRNRALTTLVAVGVLAALLGWLTARGISRPLARIGASMDRIAAKDFDSAVPGLRRRDEVGSIARNLDTFRQKLGEAEAEARVTLFKSRAFAESSQPMMMIDRNMVITDQNNSSREMFATCTASMREVWPDFDADKLIGQCIDKFHADPSHQRAILNDPSRLPWRTDISIGDLRLDLNVTAIMDANGDYVGNIMEWQDVREARLNRSIMDALEKSQVMIEYDRDFRVMKVNQNFGKVFGFGEEALGKGFEELFGVTEDTRVAKERLTKGLSVTRKVCRRGADGREVWVEVVMNPIFDYKGKLDRVVEITTDVSELERERRAADARRQAQAVEQKQVVDDLRRGLSALADGDLTQLLDQPFAEEYEELRHDFNAARDKLTDAIGQLIATTGNITSGAVEISQAADDLSRRTENQAATLEETAAALDELTSSVKSAAEGAGEADRAVRSARESAEASGEVVVQAVAAMSEIEKSSDQIGQIIGVIDDIAFQTNLLALNAGVEAARAGEAGRGFAVVASEVRSLAQRSSEAAKEIKELISASSGHVERGVSLVGQTGDALNRIVESVAHIATLVTDIASSAAEQSTGLSEINTGVNQLDEVTQQNAAMVEESTAASHSLRQEAETLSGLVSMFRILTAQGQGAEIVGMGAARSGGSARPAPARPAAGTAAGAAAPPPMSATGTDGWEDF